MKSSGAAPVGVEHEHRLRDLEAGEVPEILELPEGAAVRRAIRRWRQQETTAGSPQPVHRAAPSVVVLLRPEVAADPVGVALFGGLGGERGGRRAAQRRRARREEHPRDPSRGRCCGVTPAGESEPDRDAESAHGA